MNLQEYQESTQRTCPSLGSKELDHAHMIYGMVSELEELDNAIANQDRVNIGEELTDIHWYLSNYARMNNISYLELPYTTYNLIIEHEDYFKELAMTLSKLCDKEKRELAYKKEFDWVEKRYIISTVFHLLEDIYKFWDLYPNKCMQNNIDKLRKRYPEKFTEEKALNRDLDSERKELEK